MHKRQRNDWEFLLNQIELQDNTFNTSQMLIVRIQGFGENNPCSGCQNGVFNGTKEVVVREIVLSAKGKAIQYNDDNVAGRRAFDWDDISAMVTELNCLPDIEQILLCYKEEHGKMNYINQLIRHVRKNGKLIGEIPTIISLPQQKIPINLVT